MASKSPLRRGKQRGNIALITAIAALPISLTVVLAVEFLSLATERTKMQAAVDAAALAGAREIGISGGAERDIKGYTERFAQGLVAEVIPHVRTSFKATQLAGGAVQIDGVGVRNSFFGNLVPKGGFVIRVRALAEALNQQPLCVVGMGSTAVNLAIDGKERSRILAPNCMVHSNANIELTDKAAIEAGTIQSSGIAAGSGYLPEANSGALVLRDPFQHRKIKRKNACPTTVPPIQITVTNTVRQLRPGIHRQQYTVKGTGSIRLAPGDYYFCHPLAIEEQGTLQGTNVVLIFDKGALTARGTAKVSLTGRTSGSWAGFVLVSSRDNEDDTIVSSTFVDRLLGTIYLPNSNLFVNAQGRVAEDSLWSVVIARSLVLTGDSTLVINDNYAGSGVPVPRGVGRLNRSTEDGAWLKN